jgi:hypothetical protein
VSNRSDLGETLKLRLLIGFLGEREQAAWWQSGFLSPTSDAFLSPLFSRTMPLACYNGVSEAARRMHDERIGVGRVFHLFRLPEALEQLLFEEMRVSSVSAELSAALASQVAALAALRAFFDESPAVQEGPVQVGDISNLTRKRWLSSVAGMYSAAFHENVKCFPYFVHKL